MRFTEIEHKFVVDDRFDLAAFGRALEALGPSRRTSLRVRDRYFLTRDGRAGHYVIRHRFDAELHELTIKSLEPDPEVRDEITIALSRRDGDQAAQVDAFVARMGVTWSGVLQKDLDVWYFPDCEVVHYVASSGARTVRCVEFEATRKPSLAEALAIIERYERATGLASATRSVRSIVDLMFPEAPWPGRPLRGTTGPKGAARLTADDITTALGTVPAWTRHDTSVTRTFHFADFGAAVRFVGDVALLADEAWHHPDIDIRWNAVTVTLTTHDAGGLTGQDFALAARIDALVA